jgi:hypothetical protein
MSVIISMTPLDFLITKYYVLQGKGKKRQLGWFPASYVKMMDSAGEKSDVPVQSTTAAAESEKQEETKEPEPEPEPEPTVSSDTGTKVKEIIDIQYFTFFLYSNENVFIIQKGSLIANPTTI